MLTQTPERIASLQKGGLVYHPEDEMSLYKQLTRGPRLQNHFMQVAAGNLNVALRLYTSRSREPILSKQSPFVLKQEATRPIREVGALSQDVQLHDFGPILDVDFPNELTILAESGGTFGVNGTGTVFYRPWIGPREYQCHTTGVLNEGAYLDARIKDMQDLMLGPLMEPVKNVLQRAKILFGEKPVNVPELMDADTLNARVVQVQFGLLW